MTFLFILFRADNPGQAFDYWGRIFSRPFFSRLAIIDQGHIGVLLVFIVVLFVVEWLQSDKQHALQIDFVKRFFL